MSDKTPVWIVAFHMGCGDIRVRAFDLSEHTRLEETLRQWQEHGLPLGMFLTPIKVSPFTIVFGAINRVVWHGSYPSTQAGFSAVMAGNDQTGEPRA